MSEALLPPFERLTRDQRLEEEVSSEYHRKSTTLCQQRPIKNTTEIGALPSLFLHGSTGKSEGYCLTGSPTS